jgi:hypothetical protein
MNELFELFGVDSAEKCYSIWMEIIKGLGLEENISNVIDCNDKNKKLIIDNVNYQRLSNNPIKVSKEILMSIF